jgi:hypothetical protein
MNRLFIWSDIPGEWFKASMEGNSKTQLADAAKISGTNVLIEKVMSINDLIRLFKRLGEKSDEWDSVNFHTHGNSGTIALGSVSLNLDSYKQLENQDFGRLFAKDCVITFEGCNVAEEANGEYFLIEIAQTLLLSKGGKVRGNTGSGFGNTFSGGDSFHPFGTWITANIGAGGTLRLENGVHLNRDNIQKRISTLSADIVRCEKFFRWGEKEELEKAKNYATIWLAGGSWTSRWYACKTLDSAEDKIATIISRQVMFAPL